MSSFIIFSSQTSQWPKELLVLILEKTSRFSCLPILSQHAVVRLLRHVSTRNSYTVASSIRARSHFGPFTTKLSSNIFVPAAIRTSYKKCIASSKYSCSTLSINLSETPRVRLTLKIVLNRSYSTIFLCTSPSLAVKPLQTTPVWAYLELFQSWCSSLWISLSRSCSNHGTH